VTNLNASCQPDRINHRLRTRHPSIILRPNFIVYRAGAGSPVANRPLRRLAITSPRRGSIVLAAVSTTTLLRAPPRAHVVYRGIARAPRPLASGEDVDRSPAFPESAERLRIDLHGLWPDAWSPSADRRAGLRPAVRRSAGTLRPHRFAARRVRRYPESKTLRRPSGSATASSAPSISTSLVTPPPFPGTSRRGNEALAVRLASQRHAQA